MADRRYVTLSPLKWAGNKFATGTPVALPDSEGAKLVAAGAVAEQAGALPAMPPGPAVPVMAIPSESGPVIYVGGEVLALPGGVQVPSDWSAVSGVARILNKPVILNDEAVQDLVAAMFAGAHTNLTATYNDTAGTLTLAASGVGGGGTTAEEVQDFMNSALAHGNHSGVTVTYDDVNNRFVFTVTGGGAPIARKLTVTANSVTASVIVTGYGSTADLNQATATAAADGTAITIAGLSASFDINSITAHTPAGFNTGTAFSLVFPDPFSAASIDDACLPILMHWNIAAPAVEQAQTNLNVGVSAGVVTLQKTGLVAGTGARWKAIL